MLRVAPSPKAVLPSVLLFALLLSSLLLVPAYSQDTQATTADLDQLRREMLEMRKLYETKIGDLEAKVARLESEQAQHSQAVSSVQETATQTSRDVASLQKKSSMPDPDRDELTDEALNRRVQEQIAFNREFVDDTESRNYEALKTESLLKERIDEVLYDFVDISGYFRAGYGRNDHGGVQVPFKAPGSGSKYRLGNETENYGELIFSKTWFTPGLFTPGVELENEGPAVNFQLRMAFVDPYDGGSVDTSFPEVWASIGNIIEGNPTTKFWAGNRFYRRHDIHMTDFFFLNMSGNGGGIEDIEVPWGRLALAWIGSDSGGTSYAGVLQPDPENTDGFTKSSLDLRLYDVKMPFGKGEFALVYSRAESGLNVDGEAISDSDGYAINFVHTAEGFLDDNSFNKFSLQFGTGAAKTFTAGFETVTVPGGTFLSPDRSGSWRFRGTEHFIIQPSEYFALGSVLTYEYTDFNSGQGTRQWASFGLRPVFFFTDHFSIAVEAGVDYVKDTIVGDDGALFKITVAPQITPERTFMSRPSIRLFATYANWSNAFVGHVGGSDYLTSSQGFTWGIQMETWW